MGVLGQKYVGGGKDDVTYGDIMHAFSDQGTEQERGVVAKYCERDGQLCLLLAEKWGTLSAIFEEANACAVGADAIVETGRQSKIISLILSELHDEYVFNPPCQPTSEDGAAVGYTGATVVDTIKGFYRGPLDQVVLLDFASLYPSLMRAYGICPSRLVRTGCEEEEEAARRPGVEVHEYNLGDNHIVRLATPAAAVAAREAVKEAQETAAAAAAGVDAALKARECAQGEAPAAAADAAVAAAVKAQGSAQAQAAEASTAAAAAKPKLTVVLEKLLAERAAVRKVLKTETNPEVRKILDARQKAKKVACNSTYGLLGASKGYLPLPDLAAVTTLQGRESLQFTKRIVEEEYGARVIAGDTDSVMFVLPQGEGPAPPSDGVDPDEEWVAARMAYVFRKGTEIAEAISARLPDPLELELEGVMWPAIFLKKKNYGAKLWERCERPEPEPKLRGLVAVRNDWAPISKRLCGDALRMCIMDNAPERAVEHVVSALVDLRKHNLSIADLTISKELHSYDPKTLSPHVAVARRMRDAGMEVPSLGSKVQYVVIKRGGPNVSDRARSPNDADVSPAEIDTTFYYEHQQTNCLNSVISLEASTAASDWLRSLDGLGNSTATRAGVLPHALLQCVCYMCRRGHPVTNCQITLGQEPTAEPLELPACQTPPLRCHSARHAGTVPPGGRGRWA